MKWLSLLLLLIGFVSIAGLFRRKTVSRPLVVFLGVYSLLWNGIPFVGNFVDFEEYGAFRLIDENVYYKWASIEYLSFFLVTLFLWIRRPHLGWLERRRVWAQVVPIQILTIGLIVALGVVLGVPILIGRVLGGSVQSYTDANAFMATGGATQVYSVLGPIIWVLGVSVAFLYQYLSIDSSLRKRPGWLDALVWAGLTAYVFFSVVNGSRIMILVPLILLFVKFAGRKDRSVTAGVLVGLLGFAFFAFGTGFLASITEQRLVGKVDLDAALSQRSVEGGRAKFVAASLVGKFDSIGTGAFLVESLGGGYGGLEPYHGALMSLVPRALYRDKPVTGSVDGEYSGHPRFLTARLMGEGVYVNVGVAPSTVAYWQLKEWGLVLLIMFNGFRLWLLNGLLRSNNDLLRSLAFFGAGIPILWGVFGSPEQVLQEVQRLLVLVGLTLVVSRVFTHPCTLETRRRGV